MTLTARSFGIATLAAACFAVAMPAYADRIKHPVVVFAGLDKITGRIITFDVAVDETVQFGTIQITPRICYTRPATEAPQTTGFIEVDDVGINNEFKRIFSGWMFAASPGLHGVEHAVYDVWLTDCRGGKEIIPSPPEAVDMRPTLPPAPRQQARPVSQPPQQQNMQGLGTAIEVGPAPGSRSRQAEPAPQIIPSPLSPVPMQQLPPAQQQPGRLPSAREAPIGMTPPGNIPGR
jgi:hypothetical protein